MNKYAEVLGESLSQVFESMAFIEVVPAETQGNIESGEYLCASLPILKPHELTLLVALPLGLAQSLADSLIGPMDDSFQHDQLIDIVSELANTVGGAVARSLASADESILLGLPNTKHTPSCRGSVNEHLAAYQAEEHTFLAGLIDGLALPCSC